MVAFGTFRTDLHPRVASLIEGLASSGLRVDVVNEPLPFDTAERVALLKRPWRLPWALVAVLRCWWRLLRRARAVRRPRPAAVLVGYLGHFDVHLAKLAFPGVPVVLDHLVFGADTAADRGSVGPLVQRALSGVDTLALRRADVVVLDTDEHRALAVARTSATCITVPVAATDAWFAVPPLARADGGPLRVIFFGLFTPLQGTPTIAEAVRLLPDSTAVQLTLVGRGQDFEAVHQSLAGDHRVRFLDWLSLDELIAEVGRSDVVLGVFGTGSKAKRVVPTKVYQGLAAGRAVVTSDTSPQRRALGSSALLVPPGDPAALAEALATLATNHDRVQQLASSARTWAQERFATQTSVAGLIDALQLDPPGPQVSS